MRNIFQYIRRQPKPVRENYALGIAATFTAAVLVVWIVARPGGDVVPDTISSGKEATPFATLLKESKEKFTSLKTEFSSSTTDNQAAVAEATSSVATDLILSEEDKQKAQLDLNKGGDTTVSASSTSYTEVLIGTTTATSVEPTN